jgi:hypothetical protein
MIRRYFQQIANITTNFIVACVSKSKHDLWVAIWNERKEEVESGCCGQHWRSKRLTPKTESQKFRLFQWSEHLCWNIWVPSVPLELEHYRYGRHISWEALLPRLMESFLLLHKPGCHSQPQSGIPGTISRIHVLNLDYRLLHQFLGVSIHSFPHIRLNFGFTLPKHSMWFQWHDNRTAIWTTWG